MRAAPLVISIVALLVAALALWRAPGPLLSTGSGLDAYDFSTPEAAWRSGMQIEKETDIRAMVEMGQLRSKEQRETAKLVDAVPFGEQYILFVTHKEQGKLKYVTRGMAKVHGTDMWAPEYISEYKVRRKDKKLADRMKEWEKKGGE